MPGQRRRITHLQRRRRHLPHWEAAGETYFVTFALRRPPVVDLTHEPIARLIVDALRFHDAKLYVLFDHTVMPDHVHLIIRPAVHDDGAEPLSRVTHSLKGWLAHKINEAVGRKGSLWADESYDRILRTHEDYREKAAYIYDNPRRKGLVDDPADWPWWGVGTGGG